ncbi:molybdenum cofactor guanylyltransferase MobA [Pantoea eucrina]|uniref:Molybdenum cofactor guanylyltransferase n=1 Tax=Pantoea eucrina TaxID=472693 RepID=A0ABU5LA25_9GAMM|nr:molybdenum cofactor guanylyltransferase MobA [Pantoea eucrina]MDZ7276796.1 molybdenum cofactor guanylyltransferase MobA [Pantoea eucrina]
MSTMTGVILAGGQGSRMGGRDKGLIEFQGQPLYQHVLQRFRPQVDSVLISANRNIDRYQVSGCRIITDSIPDYSGPLAGMLSGLQHSETEWVAFCACDTPFIPENMVERLWQQRDDAPAVWVKTIARDHPVLCLLHRSLVDPLETYLLRGERRLIQFLQQQAGHAVLFSEREEAFSNINTPEDLVQEEKKM